jgi:preprotein translocase subunit SecG
MTWLTTLLIVVQVVSAISIIVLVLLQHGKGADMGAAFGGGASGSLFGATGSANFLSRSTAAVATVFFIATLGLAYTGTEIRRPVPDAGGVMSVPQGAPSAPSVPSAPAPKDVPSPASQIPGSAPASSAPAAPAGVPSAPSAPAPAKSDQIPK